jgi:alpha-1,6-mannosyltransferase
MSSQESKTRVLHLFGLASLAVYVALAVFFWTAWSFKRHWTDEVVIVCAMGALAALYFYGIKFARRAATSTIVVFAIGVGIAGSIAPPFDSTDVFFYMATGWQQAHYGSNPYSGLLRNLDGATGDPMIDNAWMTRNRNPWLDIPLPYGFLFALIARGIARLGAGSFWLTLTLFTVLNLLMHAGIALFLWKAGKLLPEGNGKMMLYLYTWNPFVVLQYLADLHNDIIVAFLVVVAAYLLLKGKPVWSLPLLVAAGLIKYITLVLVPFALIFVIRQRNWKEGVRAIVLSAGLVIAMALPYAGEFASFKYSLIWGQLTESTGSLHSFVLYSFRSVARVFPVMIHSVSSFGLITQVGLWILFAAFIARELYLSWNERTDDPLMMIQRWTSILFALIFVASSQFFAWYIGMMFPLALLTRRKTLLSDCVIALTGAHMLSFTFLRRKAIGYFLVATLLPLVLLLLHRRRSGVRQIAYSAF